MVSLCAEIIKKLTQLRELCWLGWKDLNPRNNGVRVRCLTTWRHPNVCLLDSALLLYHYRAEMSSVLDKYLYFNYFQAIEKSILLFYNKYV